MLQVVVRLEAGGKGYTAIVGETVTTGCGVRWGGEDGRISGRVARGTRVPKDWKLCVEYNGMALGGLRW